MLGDDGFGAARVEIGNNGIAVECLVGDQRVEGQSLDERRHAHRVEALSRRSTKRTRLPSASVRARILVVMPPSSGRSPGFGSPFCALAVAVDLDDRGVDYRVFH